MKRTAVLLAGLLAGITLAGVAHAQEFEPDPNRVDDRELRDAPEPDKNVGAQRVRAQCLMECQGSFMRCSNRCGEGVNCHTSCGERLSACMERCGGSGAGGSQEE